MEQPYNIGPRVETMRKRRGMKKVDLATKSGIRWAQIHKIIMGQRPHVSAETVRSLARALEVSTDYLLGMDLLGGTSDVD